MAAPDQIRIAHETGDFCHFNGVGHLADGTQFLAFVTGAFPSGKLYGPSDQKRWLAVVHRFNAQGNHLTSETRLGAYDREGTDQAENKAFITLKAILERLFAADSPTPGDIWVKLFAVEVDGVTHGLIYEQSETEPAAGEERGEWVMLEPRDIMFHPPWDSSEYST